MLKRLLILLSVLLFSLSLPAIVGAQVVQSFGADTALETGMIVELTSTGNGNVQPAAVSNEKKIYGVVINPNDSSVTLINNAVKNQTYVATSGTQEVLVTNQNGAINVGDYITVSSLDGFGNKATSKDSTILGRALGTFKGTSDSLGSTPLISTKGSQLNVQLGRIPVSIAVTANPLSSNSSGAPSFLSKAGQSLANKSVSTARLYIGLIILLASVGISGSMLYAGVRSSIISVGRNPLSRSSIGRSLIQVTLTSLFVLVLGFITVYVLLKV